MAEIQKKRKLETNGHSEEGNAKPIKLAYTVLFTNDMQKSSSFYQEVFGFSVKEDQPGWIALEAKNGGTPLGLHSSEAKEPTGTVHLCVTVPDIHAFHALLSKKEGVVVVESPVKQTWGLHKAEYKAPDGLCFSVIEEEKEEMKKEMEKMRHTGDEGTQVTEKKTTVNNGGGICHVEIAYDDMDRVTKFYTDIFGWSCTPAPKYEGYTIFRSTDPVHKVAGGFFKRTKGEKINYPALHLYVPDDIDATLEKIKAAGGQVVKEKFELPGVGYLAFFKDTEDNTMSLYTPMKK